MAAVAADLPTLVRLRPAHAPHRGRDRVRGPADFASSPTNRLSRIGPSGGDACDASNGYPRSRARANVVNPRNRHLRHSFAHHPSPRDRPSVLPRPSGASAAADDSGLDLNPPVTEVGRNLFDGASAARGGTRGSSAPTALVAHSKRQHDRPRTEINEQKQCALFMRRVYCPRLVQ
jgi:hypothetical protein